MSKQSDLHDVDILQPPLYYPSGRTTDIVTAIRSGEWLNVTNLWIYRIGASIEILFQKRDELSPMFPGLLDCSVAGYLAAGEDPIQGAVRESKEEFDLTIEPSDVKAWGRHFNAGLDAKGRERKLVINENIYQLKGVDYRLQPNPEEVSAYFWIDTKQVAAIKDGHGVEIEGFTNRGDILRQVVDRSGFVYNVDDYHFRIVEQIQNYCINHG